MSQPNFSEFAERINIKFNQLDILTQAFLHRSYLNEHPEVKLEHNERLEFLGDAVLELIVTEHLYLKYPKRNEGELTSFRAALVNTDTLSLVAGQLGLDKFLLLSRGEAKDNGRARQTILANTFEAVTGAIYLDQGYEAVKSFMTQVLFPLTEEIVSNNLWQDAKSHFQAKAQELADTTPAYRVLSEAGPDHDKVFKVGLYIGEDLIATGTGSSKQRAEQEAARAGLNTKGWDK